MSGGAEALPDLGVPVKLIWANPCARVIHVGWLYVSSSARIRT